MAQRLCDRVGIIDKSELVAVGGLSELQERVEPGGSLEQVFLKVTNVDDDGRS
jgi:ABC-type multidrug transport system ATPase subunit